MSTCLRDGHRYKRHSYKTKKESGVVTMPLEKCVHCDHPKPIKVKKENTCISQ